MERQQAGSVKAGEKKEARAQDAGREEGFIIVLAMLILLALVVVGVASINTGKTELQIAGNTRFHTQAFYHADSGVYAIPKLIGKCVDTGAAVTGADQGSVTYLTSANAFYRQVMGYDTDDGGVVDLRIGMGNFNVDVDVTRLGAAHMVGGGVEFGSGAEGVGVGSTGGVAVNYDERATGSGPGGATAVVSARYRKVVGVAGGM